MNPLNRRVKQIRQELNLSQKAFAEKMGISRDVISNIEYDRTEAKEYVLRAICREYKVNFFWLTEGKGEIFIGVPEIILDEAIEEYGLDEQDKELIEGYVKLPPEVREGLKKYLMDVFKKAPE